MPFELCNAPASIKRLMELAGVPRTACVVHTLENLQGVFELHPGKCNLLWKEAHIL